MYLLGLHIVAALLLAGGLWLVLRTGWEWKVGGVVLAVCGLAIPVGVWCFHDREETRVAQTTAAPTKTRVAHRPGAMPPPAGGRALAQTFPPPAPPTPVVPSPTPVFVTSAPPPPTAPSAVVIQTRPGDWVSTGVWLIPGEARIIRALNAAAPSVRLGLRVGNEIRGTGNIVPPHELGSAGGHALFTRITGELMARSETDQVTLEITPPEPAGNLRSLVPRIDPGETLVARGSLTDDS